MTLAFYLNENIFSVMLRACGPRPRRKIIKCFALIFVLGLPVDLALNE